MNNELVLPQSPSVEKSLIGSMLINPDLVEQVLSKLTADDFYDTINISIMKAIEVLFSQDAEVDSIIISEHLIGDSGAPERLAECMEEAMTTSHPKSMIKVILDKSARRKIIETNHMIIKQAHNEDFDLGNVVNSVEKLNENLERFCNDGGIKRRRRGRLVSVKEVSASVEEFYKNGKERQGLDFKEWPTFSNLFRLNKGTLNVFNGIPSHGKTTIVDAIMVNSILDHGWKWAVFSPENKPYYLHVKPLSEKLTGQPFFGDSAMDSGMLRGSLDKLNEHICFMEPDPENTTHEAIHRLMKEAVEKHNVDAVLVDPWNKIDITIRQNENDMKAIGRLLRQYQSFGRTNNVFVGICAHPVKMRKPPGGVDYPVPTLYDLEGSSHWYNGIDNGVTFYRNFKTNHIECHVQKIKFRTQGKFGMSYMRYNELNGRMFEITKDQIKNNNTQQPQESKQGNMWQNQDKEF